MSAVAAPDTAAQPAAVSDAAAAGTASGPGSARRRRIGIVVLWVAIVLVVLLGALAVWAAGRGSTAGEHSRAPDDPRESGAMALAQVLEQQGVEVTITHSYWEAQDALRGGGGDTTLLVDDDWWVLTEDAYESVLSLAAHTVLVQPSDAALAQLDADVEYAGFGGGQLDAECTLEAAQRAGAVAAGGEIYEAPASAVRCYASGDDGYALVRITAGDREVTLLGLGELLENRYVTDAGNAALALGLLGERPRLVWYQPDIDDFALGDTESLAARQAAWFAPLVVLLLLIGVAAAVWRGRRMGPVVVEELPVEVRSSETMEGRARLYERGGAREHALATLRTATVARLARTLGLPRTATLDDVVVATSGATGRDLAFVRMLLSAPSAIDDSALVRMSDELLRLEHELERSVHPQ